MSKAKRIFKILKRNSFLRNKRGVSEALSTMIITAGVIAMGIAILYWAYSWGNVANRQFADTVATGSSSVEERIGFEFISYSNSNNILTVNIINWGKANNVSIARIYVWDSSHNPKGNPFTPTLMNITSNQAIPGNTLNAGNEGYFTCPSLQLNANSFYTIRIVTERGRNFDGTFSTS